MKRLFTIIILSIILLTALGATTVGAAAAAPNRPAAPFTGTFSGYLYGDDDSSAPATLELIQTGRTVRGTIEVGEGLYLSGGRCGAAEVPAASQTAAGQVAANNARRIDAGATFTVQGVKMNVALTGELSGDGETLDAAAKIDLPFLCGRDPIVTGSFERE